jgi:alpha-1,2-mannosyltransferase
MDRALQACLLSLAMLVLGGFVLFGLTVAGAFAPPGAPPMALDFDAFWSAARIAVQDGARAAYDNGTIEAFERAHTTMPRPGYLAFYYPPNFLLLCLPLAVMPYAAALLAFEGAQAALLWPALKRIAGKSWGWASVLACPGFAMNVFSGQNGGLSASCLAVAMLSLDRNPWLGGACLGLLSCKPQLAACVPVALLAGRRWRACVAAAASAALLTAAATLVLGTGAWAGFLANAPAARADIETLAIKWPMMQSPYAALRLAGLGAGAGYACQAVSAILALGLLVFVCLKRRGGAFDMAALATASALVTPYLFDYDLVLMAVPIAWMAGQAASGAWRTGEKLLLALCYLAPLGARALGSKTGILIGPPLELALLAAICRRAVAP